MQILDASGKRQIRFQTRLIAGTSHRSYRWVAYPYDRLGNLAMNNFSKAERVGRYCDEVNNTARLRYAQLHQHYASCTHDNDDCWIH